jgi:hypothetical protein
LHDKAELYPRFFYCFALKSEKNIQKQEHEHVDFLKRFFVGLIDASGSIQVNHWRKQVLQFRFVLKLKNTHRNHQMLLKIQKQLGIGYVMVEKKGNFVLWVENNKHKIFKLVHIFKQYAPVTSR